MSGTGGAGSSTRSEQEFEHGKGAGLGTGRGLAPGEIDQDTWDLLLAHGFDEARFGRLRAEVADGTRSAEANVVAGRVTAAPQHDVTRLPRPSEPGYDRALAAGRAALRAGEMACVVLAGGMATRFGGVVKAAVEAVDTVTFGEIKLAQARQAGRELAGQVPVVLMTSWVTEGPIRRVLSRRDDLPAPGYFSQYMSLRLRRDGELFRTADGLASPYSCGHGDFLVAFRASGTLAGLRSRGVRHVMVSNVDNLAARPDPLILGLHITAGRQATAEVVAGPVPTAGAPVLVDGRPRFIEPAQFPPGLDRSGLLASINTITFSIDALDATFDPALLFVEKMVQGRQAVQLERAVAAGCDVLRTTILLVPADGPSGRFFPVKSPADLVRARPRLRQILAAAAARPPGPC